jgi:hypothetical protein
MFKSWKPRRWKVVTVNKSLWQASVGPKSWKYWICLSFPCILIWVNYNISLTWIKAIWGWFPLLTMIPVRSQWGRYNLPRCILMYKYNPIQSLFHGGLSAEHHQSPANTHGRQSYMARIQHLFGFTSNEKQPFLEGCSKNVPLFPIILPSKPPKYSRFES